LHAESKNYRTCRHSSHLSPIGGLTGDDWRPADTSRTETPGRDVLTRAEALTVLPDDSRVVPLCSTDAEFRTADDGLAKVTAHETDLSDRIYRGMVVLVDGRAPATPDEVAMSADARAGSATRSDPPSRC
jgi:putative ABC transport system permease protein